MADREPRRRRKRKDSQRKDDTHSEDQIFMSTRSESKDSDQEVEEEIVVVAHQPSGFAKIVFIVLFSGLVLSMSFIFISLHGADRGSVDLFDDHHSEEHEPLHNLDQVENVSSVPDHSDESEFHDSHDDDEKWSSSEFLSGNIMDMLPDIGDILSFNNENTNEVRNIEYASNEESETKSEEISDDSSQEDEMSIPHSEETVVSTDSATESSDFSFSSEIPPEELDPFLYEETEPPVTESIDFITPILKRTNDFVKEAEEVTSVPDHVTKEAEVLPDQALSAPSPEIIRETETEVYPEEFSTLEDNLPQSTLEDYSEELTSISSDSFVTPEYDEEDKLAYEKASVTNEADYEIREELDILDKKLEKNFSDNDEEEDGEDYDSDETEDEFDFWQF